MRGNNTIVFYRNDLKGNAYRKKLKDITINDVRNISITKYSHEVIFIDKDHKCKVLKDTYNKLPKNG